MARLTSPRPIRIALTLILSLALLATGWAHRLPEPRLRAALAVAERFVLVAGGQADLCGTPGDDRLTESGCLVCHLVGSALLPDPALTRAPDPCGESAAMVAAAQVVHDAPHHPAFHGRAPPRA